MMKADHPLAVFPIPDGSPRLLDCSSNLVSEDLRWLHIAFVYFLYVGTADTACVNADQHFILRNRWNRNRFQDDLPGASIHTRPHEIRSRRNREALAGR